MFWIPGLADCIWILFVRETMKCLRCHNEDPRLFGFDKGTWYCRKCISFGRLEAGCTPAPVRLHQRIWEGSPRLDFSLTPAQQKASLETLNWLQQGKDVFVYAAAGAGKTEISFASICWYMKQGKKVCFAISRRQVVLEIARRLARAFPQLSVTAVCQGHTDCLDADLIVCTTHQLFRYPYCFDLLIMDEIDAFPFAENPVLQHIADQSCRGQKLMLSATPDELVLEQVRQKKTAMVQLFARPHGRPLCVPEVVRTFPACSVLHIVYQCRRFHREGRQVLVFVPRRKDGIWLSRLLAVFWKTGWIHASLPDKDAVMQAFQAHRTEVLVCTTLLERGITVPSVQVLVYRADHPVFTQASLIQIFGRAGRSFQDPEGTGICYCMEETRSLQGCIRQLRWMNAHAHGAARP